MKQMTFADAEYAGKRKQTRKELFLIEMDRVVPWKGLIALIEPHYPKGEGGRPAYPLMAMLRVHLLQNWFGYSDPAMEEALYETTILRQFAGLNLERIPDETTILNFRRLLEKHELSFELQVYAGQAAYAAELVKAFPNVRMILVHAGMLTERTPQAIEQWRGALTTLAAFPNLHVKISGLGMYSQGITLPQARQVIRDTIQIFGVERTIYGSNFPLEKLHASYADFLGIYRKVLSEYTEAEQRAVLHDNAMRFYRL